MSPTTLTREQRAVLDHLLTGARLTRGELAERTGWSRNTVATRLGELQEQRWVGTGEVAGSGGRPATVFGLNADRAAIFAAAFGASHVRWGLVDLLGGVIASDEHPFRIDSGPEAAQEVARSALERLLGTSGLPRRRLAGAVIGLSSPIDRQARRPINPSAMPGWLDHDVTGRFSAVLDLPVSVENDAKLMATGVHLSLFPDVQDLVFIKVATGLGAGIVSGGVLQHGARGMAGEIGHLPLPGGERGCDCGGVGCIGNYATITGIVQSLRENGVQVSGLADVLARAAAGDREVTRALRQAGRELGEVLAPLLAVVNPEVLVLGGSLVTVGEELLTGMRETLYARAQPHLTTGLRTATVQEHDTAALRGAAAVGLADLLRRASA